MKQPTEWAAHCHAEGEHCLEAGAVAVAAGWFAESARTRAAASIDAHHRANPALARCRELLNIDAIVIAGGRGTRLGGSLPGDKASIPVAGWTLLEHALRVVAGAKCTVVVGPETITSRPVLWAQEDPPGAGPPAALAAGLERVSAERVIVLGGDMPRFAPAVDALVRALDAEPTADVAAMRSDDGRPQPLGCLWRTVALRAAIRGRADGASLRAMFDTVECVVVDDPKRWSADVDTAEDVNEFDDPTFR